MVPKLKHAHALTVADLHCLLEGPALSPTVGDLHWSLDTRRVGAVKVIASVRTVSGTRAQLTFPVLRPWLVTFTYLGNNVCLRRVCVNNGHRRQVWGRVHMHTYRPATGEDVTVRLDAFPIPSLHAEAKDVPYREMFAAFAGLSQVDISGLQWNDPPEVTGGAR